MAISNLNIYVYVCVYIHIHTSGQKKEQLMRDYNILKKKSNYWKCGYWYNKGKEATTWLCVECDAKIRICHKHYVP